MGSDKEAIRLDAGHGIAFFIGGALSDKRGFEYAGLGPDELPGIPARYLDQQPGHEGRASFDIQIVDAEGRSAIRFSQSRSIKPRDSDYNRGAYLSVGFVITKRVGLHVALNSVVRVEKLLGALEENLGSEGAFGPDFRLRQFALGHQVAGAEVDSHLSPSLLADLVLQAASRVGAFSGQADYLSLCFEDVVEPGDAARLSSAGAHGYAVGSELERDRKKVANAATIALSALRLVADQRNRLARLAGDFRAELASLDADRGEMDAKATSLAEELRSFSEIAQGAPRGAPEPDLRQASASAFREAPGPSPRAVARQHPRHLVLPGREPRRRRRRNLDMLRRAWDPRFALAALVAVLATATIAYFLDSGAPSASRQREDTQAVRPVEPESEADLTEQREALDRESESQDAYLPN